MLACWCRIMPQGDIPKRQAVYAGTASACWGTPFASSTEEAQDTGQLHS